MSVIKITYLPQTNKINFYLELELNYADLLSGITKYLFEDYKLTKRNIRLYWIDDDMDEIEILSERDLNIFKSARANRMHLFVMPLKSSTMPRATTASDNLNNVSENPTTANVNGQTNAASKAVHENIVCDICDDSPIVGFRYKCIQCPDYDLCGACESKHQHPDHIMVRMPNNNCPTVVEAWLSGGRCGKSRRSGRMRCPIVPPAGPAGSFSLNGEKVATNSTAGTKESKEQSSHHGRYGHKHHRRHARHGFLGNLYDMMTDLAEGGPAVGSYDVNAEGIAAAAATAAAASAAAQAAEAVADVTAAINRAAEFRNAGSASSTENPAAANQANSSAAESASTTKNSTNCETQNVKEATTSQTTTQPQPNAETQTPTTSNGQTPTTSNGQTPTTSNGQARNDNSNRTNSANATTPGMDINNLIQLIDPQYMKTGIQILNNFSDMFAKMLDPIDGGADLNISTSSNENSRNGTRKTSMASNMSAAASSTPNTTKTTYNSANTTRNDTTNANQTAPAAASTELANHTTTNATTSIAESTSNILENDNAKASKNDNRQEKGRSPSEEGDWQMIDQDPSSINDSFDNVSASTSSSSSTSSVSTSIDSIHNTAKPTAEINFEKVGKDLKAYIEQQGQQLVAQQKPSSQEPLIDLNTVTISDLPLDNSATNVTANNAAPITASVKVDAAINTKVGTNTTATAAAKTTTTATANTNSSSQQLINEEKRAIPVFHIDPRINNSVLAMMAMGFSNEGAWLTQLLESVDGNISEALDLMNTAQRNGN